MEGEVVLSDRGLKRVLKSRRPSRASIALLAVEKLYLQVFEPVNLEARRAATKAVQFLRM
jgi:hypothetical protein